jgi:hypothetical protein
MHQALTIPNTARLNPSLNRPVRKQLEGWKDYYEVINAIKMKLCSAFPSLRICQESP